MDRKKRILKFWTKNVLEGVGMAAGVSLVMTVLLVGRTEFSGGIKEILLSGASIYPSYLLIAGNFVVMLLSVGYFQTCVSLIVSMGGNRKATAGGVVLTIGMINLVIVTVCGGLWSLMPGDMAQSGIQLLPFTAGVLFCVAAIFLVFGCVSVKWGKSGKIIMMLTGAAIGAAGGLGLAMSQNMAEDIMVFLNKWNYAPMVLIGILLYLTAAGIVYRTISSLEVRV